MTTQSHSEILAFRQERGLPLIEHGSADYGLHVADAIALTQMLSDQHLPILGIEIWRSTGGRYRLHGQEVLVPIPGEPSISLADALHYFSTIHRGPDDLFTIQFAGIAA
jgi:hypothetical protein